MNEALVFIIIIIATILEGILGALLIVPLYASTVVVLEYLKRKILGQSPFEDDGANQFVMPEELSNPAGRKWGRRATDKVQGDSIPGTASAGGAATLVEEEPPPHWNSQPVSPPAYGPVARTAPTDASSQARGASIMDEESPSTPMSAQEEE